MRHDSLYIAGLGVHLPPVVPVEEAVRRGQCDAAKLDTGWLGAAVAGDLSAPEMAVLAGRQALQRSGHQAAEVDLLAHVYYSHQGPEGWTPQHYILRNTVGRQIPAIGLHHGCDGVVTALDLVAAYLAAAPGRTAALLTTADNFGTPLVDRWGSHPGLVWGDAGTALLLSRRAGFLRVLATNSASVAELEEMSRGDEPLFPPDCTVGRPMDVAHRAAHHAGGLSAADAAAMVRGVEAEIGERTLAEAGVDRAGITRVTHIHAANQAFLAHHLEPLGLDPSLGVLDVGRRVGHLGTGDHLVGLGHLVDTGQVGPGDHVLMLGLGVGTGISCAVVEVLEPAPWSSRSGATANATGGQS